MQFGKGEQTWRVERHPNGEVWITNIYWEQHSAKIRVRIDNDPTKMLLLEELEKAMGVSKDAGSAETENQEGQEAGQENAGVPVCSPERGVL